MDSLNNLLLKVLAFLGSVFSKKRTPTPEPQPQHSPKTPAPEIKSNSSENLPTGQTTQVESSAPIEPPTAPPLIFEEESKVSHPLFIHQNESLTSETQHSLPLQASTLAKLFNRSSPSKIDAIIEEINQNLGKYKLDTSVRQSHFFAQIRQEAGPWMSLEENLNYRAETLQRVFPVFKRHPEWAEKHGRNSEHPADQEKIANIAYDDQYRNRFYKLGNTRKGDGWRFRGRGLMMVTGRYNYRQFTRDHEIYWPEEGIDFEATPEQLGQPKIALRSAVHFWLEKKLFLYADKGEDKSLQVNLKIVTDITKQIQGSTFSAKDRQQHFQTALALFTSEDALTVA